MKRQYYADARDVAKWSTLIRLARGASLNTIVQITMLTSDDISNHGRIWSDLPNADPMVASFFAEERKRFTENKSSRQLDRVALLGMRFDPPLNMEAILDPFTRGNRRAYFDRVCARLERFSEPVVAFADPDTGIEPSEASEKHITLRELGAIWSTLKPGSILVVFQFESRVKDWINECKGRLARGLRVENGKIEAVTYPRVSFLFVRKA